MFTIGSRSDRVTQILDSDGQIVATVYETDRGDSTGNAEMIIAALNRPDQLDTNEVTQSVP